MLHLQARDALKDNIREAVGEIQLHTIDNVLKNWTDRVGYCMASRGSHLNEIIFPYEAKGLYFQIKTENLRKYSVVFFLKHFQKQVVFGSPLYIFVCERNMELQLLVALFYTRMPETPHFNSTFKSWLNYVI